MQPVTAVVAAAVLAMLAAVTVFSPVHPPAPAENLPVIAERLSGDPADLVATRLPDRYRALPARAAAESVAADADVALALSESPASKDSDMPIEAGLAQLAALDAASVRDVLVELPRETVEWLAVLFPATMGNLAGAPLEVRVAANAIRVAGTVARSRSWPSPDRPWTGEDRDTRPDFQRVIDGGHQLIHFDPLANDGEGSWVELVGDLSTASTVGVLVPGGSASVTNDNFTRYSLRADSFVSASDGDLAMVVWAGAPFPSGWVEEASASWAQDAAVELVAFMADLRGQLGADVPITLAGHSYGGAVVGVAETYELEADRVLHVASAGAGFGVWSPQDYSFPCRERYDLMAPGDPIGYVQNIPDFTGLGHGIEVSRMPGVKRLVTGSVPDDPDARDEIDRTLGSMGITGKEIGGVHAHSEVFIPRSDAWQSMLSVFTMGAPRLLAEQPPALPGCG